MKFILVFFCLIATLASYSQTIPLSAEAPETNNAKHYMYTLDVSTVYPNVVESLRDELMGWDDKVHEVVFDNNQHKLYITYTKLFNDIEFVEVLGKYGMSKKMIIN